MHAYKSVAKQRVRNYDIKVILHAWNVFLLRSPSTSLLLLVYTADK